MTAVFRPSRVAREVADHGRNRAHRQTTPPASKILVRQSSSAFASGPFPRRAPGACAADRGSCAPPFSAPRLDCGSIRVGARGARPGQLPRPLGVATPPHSCRRARAVGGVQRCATRSACSRVARCSAAGVEALRQVGTLIPPGPSQVAVGISLGGSLRQGCSRGMAEESGHQCSRGLSRKAKNILPYSPPSGSPPRPLSEPEDENEAVSYRCARCGLEGSPGRRTAMTRAQCSVP